MASYTLPAPGTDLGPCIENCAHIDCAETRKHAAQPCIYCGKPTGYDTDVFFLAGGRQAHADCFYDHYDRLEAKEKEANNV